MSLLGATILTAIATLALAVFALTTAIFALLAWLGQRNEVRDQAEMLRLQGEQLAEDRKVNAEQIRVLGLQAEELKRVAEDRQRDQAAAVAAWFAVGPHPMGVGQAWGAMIRNASGLPVFDVRVFFHYIAEPVTGHGWEPVLRGSSIEMVRVLPPMAERHVVIPEEVVRQMDQCSDEVYAVSITFTDAAGNRWERDPRGALSPRTLVQFRREAHLPTATVPLRSPPWTLSGSAENCPSSKPSSKTSTSSP